eukprot:gene9550-biopygen7065
MVPEHVSFIISNVLSWVDLVAFIVVSPGRLWGAGSWLETVLVLFNGSTKGTNPHGSSRPPPPPPPPPPPRTVDDLHHR